MTSNNVIYYGVHRISDNVLVGEYHYNVMCKNKDFQSFLESFTPREEFKITVTLIDDEDEEIYRVKTYNLKKYLDVREERTIAYQDHLKHSRYKHQEWMLTGSTLSFGEWIRTQ